MIGFWEFIKEDVRTHWLWWSMLAALVIAWVVMT